MKASLLGQMVFAFMAPLAWAFAILSATGKESYKTASEPNAYLSYWLLTKSEYKFLISSVVRPNTATWWQRYILGLPGYAFGLGMTIISTTVLRFVQISISNLEGMLNSAKYLINLSLTDGKSLSNTIFTATNSHWFKRYVLGAPDILLGTVLGGIGGIAVMTYKTLIINTVTSFGFLSGGYINVALGKHVMNATADDRRSVIAKVFGLGGYIMASALTFPLSMIILAGRKTPDFLSMMIGVVSSPIVIIAKSINALRGSQNNEVTQVDKVIKKFNRLEQSLTPWGKLPECELINGHHQTSSTSFMVKAITLDIDSPTERLLHALITDYKKTYPEDCKQVEKNHPEFFDGQEFKEVIAKVHQYYNSDCFASQKERLLTRIDIDNVAKFVKDYMKASEDNTTIPPFMYIPSNQVFQPFSAALNR